MNPRIKENLELFPRSPGVYLMKNRRGEILYVGKAKDLRARVKSYFVPGAKHSPKTMVMLSRVSGVEFIVTASEVEAFILESNLIKKNRPRYNVLLRDDKHYPYIRLAVQEEFPRLEVVRRIRKDGARYFGPYVPGSRLRSTLDLIERTFQLRRCREKLDRPNRRPCLNAQIGRCLGPCSGQVSREEYARRVREVILFLKGRSRALIRMLTEQMRRASRDLRFERAAVIRDQIRVIERVTEQQKIISTTLTDKDVLGIAREGDSACLEILFVRGGKLLGKKDFFFDGVGDERDDELIRATLVQYYGPDTLIPSRIFIPCPLPEKERLRKWFSDFHERRLFLSTPERGINRKLIQMALDNASYALRNSLERRKRDFELLLALRKMAGLRHVPERIEAFDISNIQGEFAVASMVVFEKGRPQKRDYRHYRIRSVTGANDVAMMEEVLKRRYDSGEDHGLAAPDLILMDGGRGQLGVLSRLARRNGLIGRADLMALAKARSGRGSPFDTERIFLPGRIEPLTLDPDDPVTHLLQRVRDESHRFAITYYRKLHVKETLSSRLNRIPGMGKKRTLSLLRHFGSLEKVRQASLEELMDAPSMNRKVASQVFTSFHGGQDTSRS